MTYKIIQWGTGAVGIHTLRAVLDHPNLQLVGVKVYSETKRGLDAGELAGRPATGVHAVGTIAELPLSEADCVLYMPRQPDYDEIAVLLRAGVHVITTAGNMYPRTHGPEVVAKLENACQEGSAVFHGSGINPAFMSDVLPLTLSGLSYRAKQIIVEEVSDVAHYTAVAPAIMMDNIGFGKTRSEALRPDNPFVAWMSAYFLESMHMIADHLGVVLDEVVPNHEVAVARNDVELAPGLMIEAGKVACRRFEWTGVANGRSIITLRTYWKTTMDIEPNWPVGSDKEVEWTITVEGSPSFQCKVATCESFDPTDSRFGMAGEQAAVIATGMHAVNAIPVVCAAAPGIRTFLDLPIIGSFGAFS